MTLKEIDQLIEKFRDQHQGDPVDQYTFGECGYFARALKVFLEQHGVYSELISLWERNYWIHDMLWCKGHVIDVRGVQTKQEVTEHWSTDWEDHENARWSWKRKSGVLASQGEIIPRRSYAGILKAFERAYQAIQ